MSSIIPLSNTPATMSSREIADLTGKEHRNVEGAHGRATTPVVGEGIA